MDIIYTLLDKFDNVLQSNDDYRIEITYIETQYNEEYITRSYEYYDVVFYISDNIEFEGVVRIIVDTDEEETQDIYGFIDILVDDYGYERDKIKLFDI